MSFYRLNVICIFWHIFCLSLQTLIFLRSYFLSQWIKSIRRTFFQEESLICCLPQESAGVSLSTTENKFSMIHKLQITNEENNLWQLQHKSILLGFNYFGRVRYLELEIMSECPSSAHCCH